MTLLGRMTAQSTILGMVVSVQGEPLPGINILAKGTAVGTVTDIDGGNLIEVSPYATVLVFSYVGFKTLEVEINGRSTDDNGNRVERMCQFQYENPVACIREQVVDDRRNWITSFKTFDTLVNDQKIAIESISERADGKFIDVQYDIPEELTVSNNEITVKFAPHEGHRAGPFFYAYMIKG